MKREDRQETQPESPHPSENHLDIHPMWADSRVNQVLKDFETATGQRNGAKIGGQRRVPAFKDWNHNAALPQCGNHTPREDEVEKEEDCRLPPREIGLEHRVWQHPTAESKQRFRARRNSDGENGASNKPGTT